MVFSFFKKQHNKMPERPAARPRPAEVRPEAKPTDVAAEMPVKAPAAPLPDLEFSITKPAAPKPAPVPQSQSAPSPAAAPLPEIDDGFSIDDFDSAFTNSSVMGIDVDHDVDPLQSCVEQVVVLYANGQDAAARSLLETFVRSYRGLEGKRFWMLLFDLLQIGGDRTAFEKLGVEYAEACESSPPTWSQDVSAALPAAGGRAVSKIFLQGVLTSESALPVDELARLIAEKAEISVDCAKLIGCDDEIAEQLADLLLRARQQSLAVTLVGAEAFMERLNERLIAGDQSHEPAWRLLLELLQRHGTQDHFEERAVDYAVTFELSPPSWEIPKNLGVKATAASQGSRDDAHYFVGELKACRFEDLPQVLEAQAHPVLDFSRVTRLDFISAGQLVNRLAPIKAAGREVVIRSPNHLVAELMAVVGLNKQARIIVPKS
ncbi:STAS domain-containing protein [Dechloromonas sp. ARDL1]|uniref:STAS domain-containing protein n=1 Tax=Dechloromonas sp. ARDL1 TaxID=3322121 RepID=UPI003DA78637